MSVDSPEALVPDREIPAQTAGPVDQLPPAPAEQPPLSRRDKRRVKVAAGEAAAIEKVKGDKPGGKRRRRTLGYWLVRFLRKVWMPLVILAVVAIAAFTVDRLHGVFGKTEITRPGSGLANDPEPFNPKVVVYEVFGPPGATATVNYLNLDAEPQIARDVSLPWSLTMTTTAPAAAGNIVAQGYGDSIGCRITVDGVVKAERWSNGVAAQTFCIVKSG